MSRVAWIAAVALAACATDASAAGLDSVPDSGIATDGAVNAIAVSGGTAYLGGSFSQVARLAPGAARVDAASSAAKPFPGIYGARLAPPGADPLGGFSGDYPPRVSVVIPDGAGGWYLGGRFDWIGDAQRQALAHVRADGSVDPAFDARVRGSGDTVEIETLALSGATLYLGGRFTSVGDQDRVAVAAVNAATGAVAAFDAKLPGYPASPEVRAMAPLGDGVFLAGRFDTVGGATRNGLAAVDAGTGGVRAWNPDARLSGSPGFVYALTAVGDTVYAGGGFDTIGGQARKNLAALRASDGGATSWNPAPDNAVFALAVASGRVYAGGVFASIGGATQSAAAALAESDGHALDWDPAIAGSSPAVRRIAVSGDTVYLAGTFDAARGEARTGAAAFDPTSAALRAWNPRLMRRAWLPGPGALAVAGGNVVLGGEFDGVNAVDRAGLAALDVASGAPLAWAPGLTGSGAEVAALAVAGSQVWAGGRFDGVTGAADCPNLAALDAATGAHSGPCPKPDDAVRVLRTDGGRLYLGGDFSALGATVRSAIAALDLPAGTVASWSPEARSGSAEGRVTAISPGAGGVFAAGEFDHIGGAARTAVAQLSATTGGATAWNAHLSSTEGLPVGIDALARGSDRLFLAGYGWDRIGSQAAQTLGAASLATGSSIAWAPSVAYAPNDNIATPRIEAMGVAPIGLVAVGSFDYLGLEHEGIGAISQTTTTGALWSPRGSGYGSRALAITPSAVLAGGRIIGIYRSHGAPVFRRTPKLQLPAVQLSYPAAIGCDPGAVSGDRPFLTARYDWLRDGVLLPHDMGTYWVHGIALDDEGHRFRCRVTMTNDEGSTSADSDEVRTVARPLVNLSPPLIAYTPAGLKPGAPLICFTGGWGGSPPAIAIAWVRDGAVVAGAGGDRYTIRADDTGHLLRCRVTATNPANSITLDSNALQIPGGGGGGGGGGGTSGGPPRLERVMTPSRMKLRTFLRRGLRVRLTPLAPLRSLKLTLVTVPDQRTARTLRHPLPKRARTLRSRFARTLVLTAPPKAKRALRRARSARLFLRVTAVGGDGKRGREVNLLVTLRR